MYYNQFGQQVIRVNGEQGARAYQLAPGGSALLLDMTGPYVWLAQADGAGYKDLKQFEIKPYAPDPQPTMSDLLTRLSALEEKVNESHTTGDERGQT